MINISSLHHFVLSQQVKLFEAVLFLVIYILYIAVVVAISYARVSICSQ